MKQMQRRTRRKVTVVGAGAVGSTFCYSLAQSGIADEIALIDKDGELAEGQVLDLLHGQPFFPTVSIHVGDSSDYEDAGLIVLTAGAAQKPGESRLDLLKKNAAITRSVVDEIVAAGSEAVLLVVSNPVDVMTRVALEHSGWERGRVLGSGTVLDSSRLRYLLSRNCNVDSHNVHGYVLGEHGDSEFVAWSMVHVAGIPIDSYCPSCQSCGDWRAARDEIEKQVRESAYHIIDYKGATCFAVGLALVRISGAILRDQKSVLTVSVPMDGQHGTPEGVCLSLPSLLGAGGVERVLDCPLPEGEAEKLRHSGSVLDDAMGELEAGS